MESYHENHTHILKRKHESCIKSRIIDIIMQQKSLEVVVALG